MNTNQKKTKPIILSNFLVLTFALSWGIAAFLILFTETAVALFGEITTKNPLYILMAYSPGLAGIFLVLKNYGVYGLIKFLQRLTLWKMQISWWFFLIIGIPILAYFSAFLKGSIGIGLTPHSNWQLTLQAIVQGLFLLGTFEEFGWRGIAQPILQRKMAPFWSGLIVGVIWATWHMPAFLFGGGVQYNAWPVIPFFAGVIAISLILTPMFNSSKGSLLVAYLFHFQVMNPLFPDTQPWDNLVFVITAICIVFINRKSMFQKGSGTTSIFYEN